METELANTLRTIIREEVRPIVREEVELTVRKETKSIMRKEIRPIIREEVHQALKPTNHRLKQLESRFDNLEIQVVDLRADMHQGFKEIDARFAKQDEKLDTILEGWTIQKIHRRELDDHEVRITSIEQRIPVIS